MPLLFALAALAAPPEPGRWLEGGPADPWFGVSVALSGRTLAVGNAPGSAGEPWAWIYEESGGEWVQTVAIVDDAGPIAAHGIVQVQVELGGDTLALFSWAWPERVRIYAREGKGWARVPFEALEAVDVDVEGDEIGVLTTTAVEIYERDGREVGLRDSVELGGGLVPHDLALGEGLVAVGFPHMGLPPQSPAGGRVVTFARVGPSGPTPIGDSALVGRSGDPAGIPPVAGTPHPTRETAGWDRGEVFERAPRHSAFGFGVAWAGRAVVASAPFEMLPTDPALRIGSLWVSEPAASVDDRWVRSGGALMASTMDSVAANERFVVSGLHFVRETAMWGGVAVAEVGTDGPGAVSIREEGDLPHFGFSVALDGDRLAVGSPRMDEREPGRVWVGPAWPAGE